MHPYLGRECETRILQLLTCLFLLCEIMVPFRSPLVFSFRDLRRGGMAGLIATIPMTISMLLGWRLLPKRERYPLPPREIIGEFTERMGGRESDFTETELTAATLLAHFGYGALTGSTYALIERKIPLRSSLKGALAGLFIWVVSYLGWIPAVRILTPATRHPWRRNLLMIFAHLVWGLTLGEVIRRSDSEK